MIIKCISKEFGVTVGKEYKVLSLEYPLECFELMRANGGENDS